MHPSGAHEVWTGKGWGGAGGEEEREVVAVITPDLVVKEVEEEEEEVEEEVEEEKVEEEEEKKEEEKEKKKKKQKVEWENKRSEKKEEEERGTSSLNSEEKIIGPRGRLKRLTLWVDLRACSDHVRSRQLQALQRGLEAKMPTVAVEWAASESSLGSWTGLEARVFSTY